MILSFFLSFFLSLRSKKYLGTRYSDTWMYIHPSIHISNHIFGGV